MFVPVFTLNLNHKLLPGRIAIGEFDGEHPCLVAATIGERVLIHTPHQKLTGSYIIFFLNNIVVTRINKFLKYFLKDLQRQ